MGRDAVGVTDKDIGHTELPGGILISTKRIDLARSMRNAYAVTGLPEPPHLDALPPAELETMILGPGNYKFLGMQWKYSVHEEERAARRHRWLVWIVCEMLELPQPSRPTRFDFLGSDFEDDG